MEDVALRADAGCTMQNILHPASFHHTPYLLNQHLCKFNVGFNGPAGDMRGKDHIVRLQKVFKIGGDVF
jgi:hypothetical protein